VSYTILRGRGNSANSAMASFGPTALPSTFARMSAELGRIAAEVVAGGQNPEPRFEAVFTDIDREIVSLQRRLAAGVAGPGAAHMARRLLVERRSLAWVWRGAMAKALLP